jgi:hypothetical protein
LRSRDEYYPTASPGLAVSQKGVSLESHFELRPKHPKQGDNYTSGCGFPRLVAADQKDRYNVGLWYRRGRLCPHPRRRRGQPHLSYCGDIDQPMKDGPPAFRIDLGGLLSNARRKVGTRVDGVTINLPFLSFNVRPDDLEQKVAGEVVIRMTNRRILNAKECCDDCIDRALASLQEIRSLLVDKQVDLTSVVDGPMYLLIEVMLEALRQFLTFEQRLNQESSALTVMLPAWSKACRPSENREKYFIALEMLRSHLAHCLVQVSKIAGVELPKVQFPAKYDEAWQLEDYGG